MFIQQRTTLKKNDLLQFIVQLVEISTAVLVLSIQCRWNSSNQHQLHKTWLRLSSVILSSRFDI